MGSTFLKGKLRFSVFSPPIGFSGVFGVFLKQKCIRLVHEKLAVFPYRQYINGILIYRMLLSRSVLCYKIEVGIYG